MEEVKKGEEVGPEETGFTLHHSPDLTPSFGTKDTNSSRGEPT